MLTELELLNYCAAVIQTEDENEKPRYIVKEWGLQKWFKSLNGVGGCVCRFNGGKTSIHSHQYHDTIIQVISGSIRVKEAIGLWWKKKTYFEGESVRIPRGKKHQLIAESTAVVNEIYILTNPSGCWLEPRYDIVRIG